MAKRNLYDPNATGTYLISRSTIESHVRCPRCFVLDRRYGIRKPSIPAFTLNSAVDAMLKREFDIHRAAGTVHPLVAAAGYDLKPFDHPDIEAWRSMGKGMRFVHEPTGFDVQGLVDDIWVDGEGVLYVVDYKSTAKDQPVEEVGDAVWHQAYRRQLEIYQWLLRQMGFTVSNTAFWFYETGDNTAATFDQVIKFEARVIAYEGNDGWVESELLEMKQNIDRDFVPRAADDCEHCKYFAERTQIAEQVGDDVPPLCDFCRKPMTRILYGYPDPQFYEQNRDTRVFGGCIIGPENPVWACKTCGTDAN
ncbi:MAG: PD-(D/E)XK nuclease family protein [Micrococcales bacterium]